MNEQKLSIYFFLLSFLIYFKYYAITFFPIFFSPLLPSTLHPPTLQHSIPTLLHLKILFTTVLIWPSWEQILAHTGVSKSIFTVMRMQNTVYSCIISYNYYIILHMNTCLNLLLPTPVFAEIVKPTNLAASYRRKFGSDRKSYQQKRSSFQHILICCLELCGV